MYEHLPAEHPPARPGWECRSCGRDWPCDPARERLRNEYADYPTVTALYLSIQQHDYLDDTPNYSLDELYERFFAWAR
ncbi:hypothetical protein AB0M20_11820 [Actinoplanes sp. NPDC051633]|uniref:hypothetical protein n=1 Tax=Actinoplanes sp. NPDC051633 TaxID=3155670 RepID=UPI00341D5E52